MASIYSVFFLDASGKMIGTDNLVADDDQSAIEAAKLSLESRDNCSSFELWLTNRLIHAAEKSGGSISHGSR
jgi:hypothetical protein